MPHGHSYHACLPALQLNFAWDCTRCPFPVRYVYPLLFAQASSLPPRMIIPSRSFCHRSWLVAGLLVLGSLSTPEAWSQAAAAPAATSLDVLFKQGADAFTGGNYDRTIALFTEILKQAKPSPRLEPVHYTIAAAKLLKGDNAGAIEAFRTYLQIYPSGAQLNDARVGLTTALINAGRMAEAQAALASLSNLRSGREGLDNYASILGLTLQVADSLLEAKKTREALILLQQAPDRAQIIVLQTRRIRELGALLEQANATAGNLSGETNLASNRDNLSTRLQSAKAALTQVEASDTFDLPRLLRQARCHLELDQPWHAMVICQDTIVRFPNSPDRAYALHSFIMARREAGPPKQALKLCQEFIATFPGHPLFPEVAGIAGQLAVQLDDTPSAIGFFGAALPKSEGKFRESLLLQLGNAYFSTGAWAQARETFERYLKEFPSGQWIDNVSYRTALSWILDTSDADRYTKAEKALAAFVEKNPASAYLSDACYRLAVCQFAFQDYKKAIAACEDWEKRFPADGLISEVLSLKGDVQKTLADNDAALETYLLAASAASSDEVMSYTLGEAGRLLEQKKDWTRLASVFSTQIERLPDNKLAMGWYYWVARAKARAGQPAEAWEFLADHVGMQITNPANEDVEKILELMAQIRSKERPAADAPSTPSPVEQLSERLHLVNDAPPLVGARLRYYQSRVLDLSRKPEEAAKIMLALGREMPADQMSAALLAVAGEALYKDGDAARATPFFNALLEHFPASDYRDFAYAGLGNLALDRNEPTAAIVFFDNALGLAGAVHRQREATVGQARSHLALGNLDNAAKLFELIAGAKEWRGEATALSLYYLGEIAVKQGDLPKGIVYFQRVFVSQIRYPEWVAKSYIASGRAYENLGKKPDAAKTYYEMLRNERMKDRPELAEARTRLKVLDPAYTP